MELRQLKYFVTVAHLQNFTRAAAAVRIAQPALSRQIRKLEAELGTILLYRDGRTATLTEAGKRFYEHAKLILNQLDTARHELLEGHEQPIGSVSLGFPPHIGPHFGVSLLDRFKRVFPKAQLRLVEAFSAPLADWIFTGRLDAALLYNAQQYKHLHIEWTVLEQLYFVSKAGDPHTAAADIQLRDVADLPIIFPDQPSSTRERVETALERLGMKANVVLEVDSLGVIKRLVAAGAGYSFHPFVTVHEEVAQGKLSASRVVDPFLEMRLSLAVPLYGKMTSLTQRLLVLVLDEVERAIGEKLWSARWDGADAEAAGST
jgi:LysR family nitrogen assimilation transcriptional regulator